MAVDNGAVRQEPERKPLQLKRATAKAFIKANPVLLKGEPAFEYDMQRLKIGDGYTRYRDLPYIADARKIPKDGKSAYDLWLDEGHEGTVEDFLDSLIGEPGKSTYEIWLSLGHEGTVEDFIDSIKGDTGKSAYEIWLDEGHEGTVEDFLDSLIGKSAYEIWLDLGFEGSESDFIKYLTTTTWGTF